MNKVLKNNYTQIGKTMTTQEYLEKRKQDLFDKEFDELLKRNSEEKAKQQAEKEKQERFAKLVSTLNDCEAELEIMEDLYKQWLINPDIITSEKEKLKQEIKNITIKYTKTKHQIDDIIRSEK